MPALALFEFLDREYRHLKYTDTGSLGNYANNKRKIFDSLFEDDKDQLERRNLDGPEFYGEGTEHSQLAALLEKRTGKFDAFVPSDHPSKRFEECVMNIQNAWRGEDLSRDPTPTFQKLRLAKQRLDNGIQQMDWTSNIFLGVAGYVLTLTFLMARRGRHKTKQRATQAEHLTADNSLSKDLAEQSGRATISSEQEMAAQIISSVRRKAKERQHFEDRDDSLNSCEEQLSTSGKLHSRKRLNKKK